MTRLGTGQVNRPAASGSSSFRGASISDGVGDHTVTAGTIYTVLLPTADIDTDGFLVSPGVFQIPADPGDGLYRVHVNGKITGGFPTSGRLWAGFLGTISFADDVDVEVEIPWQAGDQVNPHAVRNVDLSMDILAFVTDTIYVRIRNDLDIDVTASLNTGKWRYTIEYLSAV